VVRVAAAPGVAPEAIFAPPPKAPPLQRSVDEPASEVPPISQALGRRREMSEAEMDMTPMVDVTFQLLIFFMVTAAFSLQSSIPLPAPKDEQASTQVAVLEDIEDNPDYVTVRVDENNTYIVETLDWEAEAPSKHEMIRKLREARLGNSAGKVPNKLLVRASGDAHHEAVVGALDAGTEVGMEEIQLATSSDDPLD
jgi:biopolymer transport protein ExbD